MEPERKIRFGDFEAPLVRRDIATLKVIRSEQPPDPDAIKWRDLLGGD